jgi:hypothetical protein
MAHVEQSAVAATTQAPGITPGVRTRLPLYLAWLVYGTILVVSVGSWLIYALHQSSLVQYAYRYDFLGMYIGLHAVATGQGAQLYDLTFQRQIQDAAVAPYLRPLLLPYIYPGYSAVVFAPLGFLDYGAAFLTWGVLNLALLGGALVLLVRLLAGPPGPPPGPTPLLTGERVAMLLAALGFMPILLTLLQGQWSLLSLLGLAGAILALRAGREGQAGAWLVLAALVKPQLLVVLLVGLAIARYWRAIGIFGAGMGGLALLSLGVLGNWLPAYSRMLAADLGPLVVGIDYPSAMQNWRSLIYALLGTETTLLAQGLLLGLSAASLALVVWLCWPHPRAAGMAWDVRWALVILLGILVVPHLYLHDVVIALVPGFLLWRASSHALAALVPGALARRLHLLRWLLGLGPLILFAAQFWGAIPNPIQIGPWYLALLVSVTVLSFDVRGTQLKAREGEAYLRPHSS